MTAVLERSLYSLARDETSVVSALGPTAQALTAAVSGKNWYHSSSPLPDRWQRLADIPEYASFAHRVLETAHGRVSDIQSGRIAYKADAAFDGDEVRTLGRAVQIALLRDEPWLMELLRPLLLGVAVAPTAARTSVRDFDRRGSILDGPWRRPLRRLLAAGESCRVNRDSTSPTERTGANHPANQAGWPMRADRSLSCRTGTSVHLPDPPRQREYFDGAGK